MSEVQTQLPLIVPVSGMTVSVRFDALELGMLDRIHRQSGMSKLEIVRRALRFVRQEKRRLGSFDFLDRPEQVAASRAKDAFTKRGRTPRTAKITELERSIQKHLKALETETARLTQLKARAA